MGFLKSNARKNEESKANFKDEMTGLLRKIKRMENTKPTWDKEWDKITNEAWKARKELVRNSGIGGDQEKLLWLASQTDMLRVVFRDEFGEDSVAHRIVLYGEEKVLLELLKAPSKILLGFDLSSNKVPKRETVIGAIARSSRRYPAVREKLLSNPEWVGAVAYEYRPVLGYIRGERANSLLNELDPIWGTEIKTVTVKEVIERTEFKRPDEEP